MQPKRNVDEVVEEVSRFYCLGMGSQITNDGRADADVSQRIHKVRQAYGMLNKVDGKQHT